MRITLKKTVTWLFIVFCTVTAGFYLLNWGVQAWYQGQYSSSVANSVKPKILVVWYRGIGEQETIERLKIASSRIGIDLRVVTTGPRAYIRWFVKDPVGVAISEFKPDFLLTIQDWLNYYPGQPNYMTLTLGTDRYINKNEDGKVELINPEHYKFDALLPSFQDIDLLQQAYETTGKTFRGFAWYPTAQITDFNTAAPKKLFYSGGFLWDETRGSQKYRDLFVMLDRTGYFVVCGPKRKWKHTPNSAIGFIPVDGSSLLAAHNQAGVTLLLHHQLHFDGGAPTGRIFEAAAANTVIISDRHPFVVKHFGDNVLYIDMQADAATMFKQIDEHMAWIKANPAAAQRKAANCNTIYKQQFSMEEQLLHLVAMHRSNAEM